MSKKAGKNVLILLSGGIDSAACAHFYLSQGRDIRALFVDYGQVAAKHESEAAKRITKHFSIPLNIVSCSGAIKQSGGLVLGRNTFLLSFALTQLKPRSGIIAIGIHAGTDYFDCSRKFVSRMQSIFDDYSGGQTKIGTPFLKWNKREIWDYCTNQEIPVRDTYSCELGRTQPCGRCLSCRDLEKLRARA